MKLSLNADVGEGFGHFKFGHDASLMPLITAANIACGMHAGDPTIMTRTVRLAKQHDVSVGAHPGFNDLWGFGRRRISMAADDIEHLVAYQIGALIGLAAAQGVKVRHVKPHGALNNMAEIEDDVAAAIARGIRVIDRELAFIATAGSKMIGAGHREGLRVISEVYADRTYGPDGRILPRHEPRSLFCSPEQAARQIRSFVEDGIVTAINGEPVAIAAETICVHSDNDNATEIASAVRGVLIDTATELVSIS